MAPPAGARAAGTGLRQPRYMGLVDKYTRKLNQTFPFPVFDVITYIAIGNPRFDFRGPITDVPYFFARR